MPAQDKDYLSCQSQLEVAALTREYPLSRAGNKKPDRPSDMRCVLSPEKYPRQTFMHRIEKEMRQQQDEQKRRQTSFTYKTADFISLSETWIESKDCNSLKTKLSNSWHWKIIEARRGHKKGRAKGGFLIGVKKNWCCNGLDATETIYEGLIKTVTKVKKLQAQWAKRAYSYESTIKELGEDRLIKICYLEKRNAEADEIYNVSKTKFLSSLGLVQCEIETMETLENDVELESERSYRDIFNQIVSCSLREAKYNPRFELIKTEQVPKYLSSHKERVQIDIIAKIRCGNFKERNKYWLGEELRKCIRCEEAEGSLEHLILKCSKTKDWIGELPDAEGEGKWKLSQVM
ncbi:hypothetical protein QAD02_009382 [Eretmocerus hayati]|uniref:Uncharacterized protein n=1 Tax=Eretmocerus hayati TaxID=131215 RepID=A0ACC2N928_9HYME|nr:hypothetical protein QAD02_009382 [Eretmocerus hayati]